MPGPLDQEIKVRVSKETKDSLILIASHRGEGTKISDIVREAIQEYLSHRASSDEPDEVLAGPATKAAAKAAARAQDSRRAPR